MKKKEQFITRTIAGDIVMMPVGQTTLKFNGLIMANAVSAFIWDHVEDANNAEELATLICEEFEVSYEEALNDASELLKEMEKAGWIEMSSECNNKRN